MRGLVIGTAILCAATLSSTTADDISSLGYSQETVITGPGPDACAAGVLIANHDGSFENGYAFRYGGGRASLLRWAHASSRLRATGSPREARTVRGSTGAARAFGRSAGRIQPSRSSSPNRTVS
jgi:hypothetical protein